MGFKLFARKGLVQLNSELLKMVLFILSWNERTVIISVPMLGYRHSDVLRVVCQPATMFIVVLGITVYEVWY